jgi:hypothetical protein
LSGRAQPWGIHHTSARGAKSFRARQINASKVVLSPQNGLVTVLNIPLRQRAMPDGTTI